MSTNLPSYQFMISIHALREEGDPCGQCVVVVGVISIHALREEGDSYQQGLSRMWTNFYPRPPRGGRPAQSSVFESSQEQFLSTPSARRATASWTGARAGQTISIHALREEGDVPSTTGASPVSDFYPRPPRGGRQIDRFGFSCCYVISIHALREEGDAARN